MTSACFFGGGVPPLLALGLPLLPSLVRPEIEVRNFRSSLGEEPVLPNGNSGGLTEG